MDAARLLAHLRYLQQRVSAAYKPLPTFAGEAQECPHGFLKACEEAFGERKIPEDDWIDVASGQLGGAATCWYESYHADTWEAFKKSLAQRFASAQVLAALKVNLYGHVQASNEPAEDFLLKKYRILRRLEPQVQESEVIPILAELLMPEIRPYVRRIRPATVFDLIDTATAIQEDLGNVSLPHPGALYEESYHPWYELGDQADVMQATAMEMLTTPEGCSPEDSEEADDPQNANAQPRAFSCDDVAGVMSHSAECGDPSEPDDVIRSAPASSLAPQIARSRDSHVNCEPSTEESADIPIRDRPQKHQVCASAPAHKLALSSPMLSLGHDAHLVLSDEPTAGDADQETLREKGSYLFSSRPPLPTDKPPPLTSVVGLHQTRQRWER